MGPECQTFVTFLRESCENLVRVRERGRPGEAACGRETMFLLWVGISQSGCAQRAVLSVPLLALFLPPHAGKDNLAKSNSEHPVVRITSSCVLCGVQMMENRLSVRSLRFLRVACAALGVTGPCGRSVWPGRPGPCGRASPVNPLNPR